MVPTRQCSTKCQRKICALSSSVIAMVLSVSVPDTATS